MSADQNALCNLRQSATSKSTPYRCRSSPGWVIQPALEITSILPHISKNVQCWRWPLLKHSHHLKEQIQTHFSPHLLMHIANYNFFFTLYYNYNDGRKKLVIDGGKQTRKEVPKKSFWKIKALVATFSLWCSQNCIFGYPFQLRVPRQEVF